MILLVIALILSLLADAGITYAIYASGANPLFCLFAIIIWFPIFILLFGLWVLILIVWGAFLSKKKVPEKPNHFFYSVIRQTVRWFFFLGRIHVHVRGESLPENTPCLVVSNHRSNFDQMALIHSFKRMLISITKPENLDFPIAGPFIRHAGFIPINRENMTEGIETIHRASSYLTQKYCDIGVCPEGTRNKTDEPLLPFKPGSFHIATDVRAPIAICCIKNTDKVSKQAVRRSTHIFIDILRVVDADEYEKEGLSPFVAYCESIIRRDLDEGDFMLELD